ncbi:hypothetical protein [Nocardia terpenica]|uniref:MinD-like ATPase involved in chromosome partitioning or flagellar assembly n=1 Tax=Nocardia terpenica TaxID=455432 RepID=A0A164PGB2_9NOCA|nr:hypothetical protein [Nocardia terpenica]KZM75531.1 hypothetical protein AWN90_19335 [Nocardia terpenica]NQE86013.1 hypothetical protein [Nocardia terpenica]
MSTEFDIECWESLPVEASDYPGTPPHALAHLVPRHPLEESVPAILVVGGCGGAGATTTALGLAAAVATTTDYDAVAVDATATGGDLGLRGADELMRPVSMQSWLAGIDSGTTSVSREVLSCSSSGAGLLWRDEAPLPKRTTVATAAQLLTLSGYFGVYDGGYPVSSRHLLPLIADGRTCLVLTIPARADAANRMGASLQWLDDNLGGDVVADTTVVVSHQSPDTGPVADRLRRHLAGWVRDVLEVPFDPHLTSGLAISVDQLTPATSAAYARIVEGVWP